MSACNNMQTANAQNMESLISPGELVTSHAEVDSECSSCHKLFSRSQQNNLCIECHEDVGEDIGSRTGHHGKFADARTNECAACHTDHEGRGADIVGLNESTFDHFFTDFELLGKHLDAFCVDCHKPSDKHRDAPGTCIDCHQEVDVHKDSLGSACADCHNPTDWEDAEFDHDATDYPLIGHHIETDCLDCHEDPTYLGAPTDCFACHKADDAHDGRSGNECGNCHSPIDWDDTIFDHGRDTQFPLEGSHGELTCNDCHSEDPFTDEMDRACLACHLDDDVHEGEQGEQCQDCHNEASWEEAPYFAHDLTRFPLLGEHDNIECESCHETQVFADTASDCIACHSEDDAHDGRFVENCGSCHNPVAWDLWLFDHNTQSDFPLSGAHLDVACNDCHRSSLTAMRNMGDSCGGCHRSDDVHDREFGLDCGRCHSDSSFKDVRSLQ